jgi:opacity protein-like surface antigen
MRSKLVLAALIILSSLPVVAQVAPAARISGLPIGVGVGLSDYDLDYGQDRRMLGLSAWANYELFHGLGVEAEGTTIQWDKPEALTRMRQDTIKGGPIYKFRPIAGIHPYVKYLFGLGSIDFPSDDPFYTHDTYKMSAFGGGVEYRVWRHVFVRADYEYQRWPKYHSVNALTPNGITLGATYYVRSERRHY